MNGNDVNGNSIKSEIDKEEIYVKHQSYWRYFIPLKFGKKKNQNEIAEYGFLQLFFFTWVTPFIWRGTRKILEAEDLGKCPDSLQANHTVYKLHQYVSEERKRVNEKDKMSFFRIFILFFHKQTLVALMVLVVYISAEFFLSAIALRKLLEFLESNDDSMKDGFSLVIGIIFLLITRTASKNMSFFVGIRAGVYVKSAFQALIYEKMLKLKNTGNQSVGELVNLCSNDCQRLFECCITLPFLIIFPFDILLISTYLYYYFGAASLFSSAIMVLYVPLQFSLGKLFTKLRGKAIKFTDKRAKMISEALTSIKLIKLYAWEESFSQIICAYRKKEKKIIQIMDIVQGFTYAMSYIMVSLTPVAAILTHKALGEEITVQKTYTLIALYNVMSMFVIIGPLGIRGLAETTVALKRIKKFFNEEEYNLAMVKCVDPDNVVEVTDASFAWQKTEDVEVEEDDDIAEPTEKLAVSFEPDNTKKRNTRKEVKLIPTLFNINLTIKKKSLIGICGSVGAGKSSFVEALLNEMTLTDGSIRATNLIGYVPQQAWIMNATIRDNILLGKKYEESFFQDVCVACCLDEDLKNMKSGDLTEIGERGINLSGGQKQRISLARAVYAEKELYLLDDPLSAVDSHVGKHIFEKCIKLALRKHTVVFVTHQLQYLQDCDYVIYMKDGRFAEEGTYQQLVNNKQEFAESVKKFHKEHEEKKEPNNENSFPIVKMNSLPVRAISSSSFIGLEDLDLEITEEADEEDKRLTEEGRLVVEEDMVKGSVSLKTYINFCKFAGGVIPTLVVILSSASSVVVQVTAEYFLTQWLSSEQVINEQMLLVATNMTYANNTILSDTRNQVAHYSTLYWSLALSNIFWASVSVFSIVFIILRASSYLHNAVLDKIFHAPLTFFESTPLGRIINRMTKDVDEIDNFLPLNIQNSLIIFFRSFGPVVFICITLPYYTFLAILQILGMGLLSFIYRKVVRSVKRIDNVTRSPIYSHITTTLQGLVSVRAYNKQSEFTTRFNDYVDENINASYLYHCSTRWFALYSDMVCMIGVIGVSIAAIFLKDTMSPALIGLCLVYTIKITGILQYCIRMMAETESRFTSVERLIHYINTLETEGLFQTKDENLLKDWPNNGVISFDKISFRYRENMPLALKNISFDIKDKEKIGIVGRTGAGKSSLATVLYRLGNVEKGSIKISGQDIKNIGLSNLRGNLSMIPQDPVLFIGTIRYNLDPFNKVKDEELWNVLEKAHMKNSVFNLPLKLESIVAENGSNFSVGERQLICMARALLRKNKILILDEATAAIDPQTDSKIQDMIKEAFSDCTVLTIAHRLNTIMHCDRILVMDKGEIAEFESPSTLLEKDSFFKSMVLAANVKTHE